MTTDGGEVRVVMPRLGESIVEATVLRFRVKIGDAVSRGQIVAEVETDKATSEIPAPSTGVVRALLVEEGATVEVGTPLLALSSTAQPAASSPTVPPEARPAPEIQRTRPAAETQRAPIAERTAAELGAATIPALPSLHDARLPSAHLARRPIDERGGPVRSSPAVRRLARRYGLDIGGIEGSGKNGRVTREDVLRSLAQTGQSAVAASRSLGSAVAPPDPSTSARAATPPRADSVEARPYGYVPPTYKPEPRDRVVPFSRRRTQIAGHMVHSLRTAAHVFAIAEIDVSSVLAAKAVDTPLAERAGVKLTFMPYVVAAVARALSEHPELNATVQKDALVLRAEKNIGVAVDTAEGLVVPVIRRADELGILGIARALGELAERARSGGLTPSDLSGGSFTISNPGKDGNLVGLSVIRQPEVAILRMGSVVKRPVVRELEGEDVIVVRPMMYAALSYDHRVIDGRTGNAFLSRLTQLLTNTRPALGGSPQG